MLVGVLSHGFGGRHTVWENEPVITSAEHVRRN